MLFRYWVIIIILGIAWGSSLFFNEILVRELGPLSASMGRVGIGALGCWVWVIATRRIIKMTPRLFVQLMVFGLFQYAAPFAIYPAAQNYITSGAAGIINAMTPIMVVIVSHIWPGGEKATMAKSAGVAFGFGGIVLLALPALKDGGESEFTALMFAMLAPVCYGIALNYVRRLKDIDPAAMTAWSLTCATLIVAPLALWVEGVPVITQAETWGALLFIGFALTSAAFIALFWLLPRVGATTASTITFIAPISAVLLGVWLLGEEVGLPHLLGMAAIFAGLLLIDGRIVRRFQGATSRESAPE